MHSCSIENAPGLTSYISLIVSLMLTHAQKEPLCEQSKTICATLVTILKQ